MLLVIFIFFSLVQSAYCMQTPAYLPLYLSAAHTTNKTPNTLTRKWLNWVYQQNTLITSCVEVQSNFNYYHELIKTHYNYLLQKDKNRDQIKKEKIKNLLFWSGINAAFWSATAYLLYKGVINERATHFLLGTSTGILGCYSFILNCLSLNSFLKHDRMMARHLSRDKDILHKFEVHKAGLSLQTQSI